MGVLLPNGWAVAALGDLCLPVATVFPEDTPNAGFTYFDIGGIDNALNRVAATKTVLGRHAPSRARQAVRKGDILFSNVRTYLKNIARVEQDFENAVASTGFTVVRAAAGVSAEYLFYWLLSDEFLEPLHILQSGSSYPAVRDRDVLAQPVRLPPFAEQERIVVKLQTMFADVARGEESARQARVGITSYRSAVVKAALSGVLTRAWRKLHTPQETGAKLLQRILAARRQQLEEKAFATQKARGGKTKSAGTLHYTEPAPPALQGLPALPKTWRWATLDMIAEIGSGIAVSQNRRIETPQEVPYLRVANVLRGSLDLKEVKTIRMERSQVDNYLLKPGDILFNEGGDRDKLGRGWIWEGQIAQCVHQNHVFRARPYAPGLVDARLVSHWGNTFGQQFFVTHGTQTTNLASINRSVLMRLPVPLAPCAEQNEISQQLAKSLATADRLAAAVDTTLSRANSLRQSFLREALAGRMLPQDENDEPAGHILARLRAARESEPSTPKRMPRRIKSKVFYQRRGLLELLLERGEPMEVTYLFHEAGFTQDTVDLFYAELRTLTEAPARVGEIRNDDQRIYLKALS